MARQTKAQGSPRAGNKGPALRDRGPLLSAAETPRQGASVARRHRGYPPRYVFLAKGTQKSFGINATVENINNSEAKRSQGWGRSRHQEGPPPGAPTTAKGSLKKWLGEAAMLLKTKNRVQICHTKRTANEPSFWAKEPRFRSSDATFLTEVLSNVGWRGLAPRSSRGAPKVQGLPGLRTSLGGHCAKAPREFGGCARMSSRATGGRAQIQPATGGVPG